MTSYLVFPAPEVSRAAESASQTWPRTLAAAGAGPVAGAGLGCPGGRSGQSPPSARGQSRAQGQAGTSASQRLSPIVSSEMKINVRFVVITRRRILGSGSTTQSDYSVSVL